LKGKRLVEVRGGSILHTTQHASTTITTTPLVTGGDSIGHNCPHAYRKALHMTALAVGAAFAFGGGLWYFKGKTSAMEFLAGYLIEESLSVDNIFVFIMLFEYFKVGGLN